MRWSHSRFARWHLWTVVALWLGFSGLTLWIASHGIDDSSDKPTLVFLTALGTPLGPMTGAISRGFQSCCVAFSLSLLPYCLSGLAIAVLLQLALPSGRWWSVAIRATGWIVGLVVWFGAGIVSFGHALS
jgi:hypothetical protein